MANSESFGQEIAQSAHAEGLGRVVARGDEVDALLARVRHDALRRLAREKRIVAARDGVGELTRREPLAFLGGPERVRTIGIISGAGAGYLGEAIAAGHDAFLTGEPVERVMLQAREEQIHFVAGGHYATETFGVRRLGELVAERFGVEHEFIEVPNPV